jgi:hypothetical protein
MVRHLSQMRGSLATSISMRGGDDPMPVADARESSDFYQHERCPTPVTDAREFSDFYQHGR